MDQEHLIFHENDWVPNNAQLPVILYRHALPSGVRDAAERIEQLFARHGWPPDWRDGIYDYHHYHSTAHEALGVVAGHARLMLGGPGGLTFAVKAGDALILPVGTGHCCVEASDNFLVIGAYPAGQDWDICRTAPSAAMRARMHDLPVPAQDPVAGPDGDLVSLWKAPISPA